MWARTAELMIGCWLLMSPFIFQHSPDDTYLWWGDLAAGSLLILFASLSFWHPTRRVHGLTPLVGLVLIGTGFAAQPHPIPPGLQNYIVVGLLVIMTGIIPSNALMPPEAWEELEKSRQEPKPSKDGASKESSSAA